MPPNQTLLANTARIFRIGRKVLGHTQVDVAAALGVSHGTVSKYEAGILQPSALDWFNFCTLVNIDSYRSLKDGYIDNCSRIQEVFYAKMGFTVAKRYQVRQHLKVREVLPLVHQVQAEAGPAAWDSWLKRIKMDPDYFHVYDAPLSVNFMQDLLASDILKSKPQKFLEKAARFAGDLANHGNLRPVYSMETEPFGLLRTYVNKTNLYEDLLSYQSTNEGKYTKLTLDFKANAEGDTPAFRDLYLNYKVDAIRHLICDNAKARVEVLQERNRRVIILHNAA